MNRISGLVALLCGVTMVTPTQAAAAAAADRPFYEGKTIRVVIGFSAGGGFDASARALARHMNRYIPGHPNIIVDPMPGAASMVAASFIFSQAKPDGLTIGYVLSSIMIPEIIGTKVAFESRRFEWIGSPTGVTGVCVTSKASGIVSLEAWKAAKEPVKFGAAGQAGDISYDTPKILAHGLGLPLRLVTGHKGLPEMKLAIQRGELAGMCQTLESANVVWGDAYKTGEVQIIVQTGAAKDPAIPDVPLGRDVLISEESRQMLKTGVELPAQILRVLVLPPRTPKDKIDLLRKAFIETLKDAEFLADAKKVKMEVNPTPGADVERIANEFHAMPAPIKQKLKEVLSPN